MSSALLPAGLRIGHAHCPLLRSGVTVILPDAPVVMAADVRGGGPGTRETDALKPDTLVERVHALVLAGGSVFGLAAADAVAVALAHRSIGLQIDTPDALIFVPVVPSAILFDLANGGDKGFAGAGSGQSPYPGLGISALDTVTATPQSGAVGAGFGARAGARAGGIGLASARLDGGGVVAALVAVNSFGEVTAGEPPSEGPVPMPKRRSLENAQGAASTCIGAIMTDVPLTRPAAQRLAMMAHDGLARAIRPIHTPFDGDTLFALSTASELPSRVDPVLLAELGTRAADCVLRAVRAAVKR